jgi:hypothetical protein
MPKLGVFGTPALFLAMNFTYERVPFLLALVRMICRHDAVARWRAPLSQWVGRREGHDGTAAAFAECGA